MFTCAKQGQFPYVYKPAREAKIRDSRRVYNLNLASVVSRQEVPIVRKWKAQVERKKKFRYREKGKERVRFS